MFVWTVRGFCQLCLLAFAKMSNVTVFDSAEQERCHDAPNVCPCLPSFGGIWTLIGYNRVSKNQITSRKLAVYRSLGPYEISGASVMFEKDLLKEVQNEEKFLKKPKT